MRWVNYLLFNKKISNNIRVSVRVNGHKGQTNKYDITYITIADLKEKEKEKCSYQLLPHGADTTGLGGALRGSDPPPGKEPGMVCERVCRQDRRQRSHVMS